MIMSHISVVALYDKLRVNLCVYSDKISCTRHNQINVFECIY